MRLKEYIKRGLHYIRRGQPQVMVNLNLCQPANLLEGRTVLITGGASGIGFEIAKSVLAAGGKVILTGRHEEKLLSAKKALGNDKVFSFVMDNCATDTFEDILQKMLSTSGIQQIDTLINNAGFLGGNINTTTEEEYDKVMNTNLRGDFFLSRTFARYLIKNQIKGNILNIASSSSLRPADSAYNLSKWGVRGLTLGLAKALVPYGITVNGIAPGPTATPMMHKSNNNLFHPNLPLGRYITPEEIASMAVIMISDIGKSIIGDIVYMTGGAGTITYDDVTCTLK